MNHPTTVRRSGQAAPELVGIVTVIALMLGVLAATVPSWRLPGHPPPLLDHASRPLNPGWSPSVRKDADPAPASDSAATGAMSEPDPAWYRRYPTALGRGFVDRGKLRVRQVVRDPIGTAMASVQALNPAQMVRDGREGVGGLRRRLDAYRRMERDDALEAMLYDLGGFTFDAGLRRAGVKAARAGAGGIRNRRRGGSGGGGVVTNNDTTTKGE